MKRSKSKQGPSQESIDQEALQQFWQEQIREYGRKVFFIDTGGILRTFENDEDFLDFLNSLVNDQLVTSTYVLAEAVRRIVKADLPHRFIGPSGQRSVDLAIYVLTQWLQMHNVKVISLPHQVFEDAKVRFQKYRDIGCDLVDIISFVVVSGLEQNRIVSPDGHFRRLGLVCHP